MLFLAVCAIFASIIDVHAFGSDWKEKPTPYFPSAALERDSAGSVVLRVIVNKEGAVDHAVVSKSSGDRALDEAARVGVLKWKMKRNAIKPSDLTSGRAVIIDFREEAALAARFANGVVAGFSDGGRFNPTAAEKWRSAPFPSYPEEARQRHEEGTVQLIVTLAPNGDVQKVDIVKSSGYSILDQAAVRAVQRWKAHPGEAGRRVKFPITFTRRRYY